VWLIKKFTRSIVDSIDAIDHLTHLLGPIIMMQPASFMMIDHHHIITIAFHARRKAVINACSRRPKIFPLSTVEHAFDDVAHALIDRIAINRPAI